MDRNAEHDGERVADQPTHSRFYRCHLCEEPSIWPREWEVITDPTLVQVTCGYRGFYHHFAGEFVAQGV